MKRLRATITRLRRDGTAVHGRTGTYQLWARAVARYSFETYQLHTDPDPDPGVPSA